MSSDRGLTNLLLIAASIIVLLAGMRAATTITVPLLMAAFVATIASTPLFWLRRKGTPLWLALLLVILIVMLALSSIWYVISNSIREFNQQLPVYQDLIGLLLQDMILRLESYGVEVPENFLDLWLVPGQLMQFLGVALSALSSVLSNSVLILITVIFILLEISSFPTKLRALLREPETSLESFNRFTTSINHYIAIKTTISLITGLAATALCFATGVDFPLLWGLVAFLLNYIPTFGSLVAGIPPVLLAAIQFDLTWASILAVGYLVINNLLGGVIEPRLLGYGLGISPLVVLLSLFFWGWLLGPVGLFLAVPLTTALKIAFESHPKTCRLAILLGPARPSPHLDDNSAAA